MFPGMGRWFYTSYLGMVRFREGEITSHDNCSVENFSSIDQHISCLTLTMTLLPPSYS